MSIEVGAKLQGKVSGITNFGAFIDLGAGKTGLVHISEVSNGYVKDFDSLMSSFLKDSDDRLSSLKRNTEGKRGGRGGRRS